MKSFGVVPFVAAALLLALAGCGGNTDQPARSPQFAPQLFASTGTDVVSGDDAALVQALYVSYFGRPADPGGLANFKAQLTAYGVAPNIPALIDAYSRDSRVKALIDSFASSPESTALYGGDNTSFVSGIYQNLFKRAPDAQGLAFWVGAINSGQLGRARASLDILAGALNNGSAQGVLDATLINKKITMAGTFTGALANAAALGYNGDAAAARARAMLSGLDVNAGSGASDAALAAALNDLAAMGGGWTYSDRHVALSQGLYVAYFGRPATPGELSAMSISLNNAAAPTTLAGLVQAYDTSAAVRSVIDTFAQTKEWKDQYLDTGYVGYDFTFVKRVYNNLFNHDPDFASWESIARSIQWNHLPRTKVGLSIAAGATGIDADLAALKVKTAASFTTALTAAGTSNRYQGTVGFSIARALLQDIASTPDGAAIQTQLQATMQTLDELATGKFTEVVAVPRKVVLLVGADQAMLQATRLSILAGVLAADLNGRIGPRAPSWSVEVITAASTAQQARQQLLNAHSAILIGNVPMPTLVDQLYLDAYRLPACPSIQFSNEGTTVNVQNTAIDVEPACRNGASIAVLRGTSSAMQTTQISRKLDQMIDYHRNSQAANANWDRSFTFVAAAWGDDYPWVDVSPFWDSLPMFAKDKAAHINSGTAAQRRAAFLACLSSKSEVCATVAHGSPSLMQFEGPGAKGSFYSTDVVNLTASDLAAQPVRSKYVELVSCEALNFSAPDSIGSTLLMSGDTLLANGFTTKAWINEDYFAAQTMNHFIQLNAGATFAEAWSGGGDNGPAAFQGDPFITMRPVAAQGKRPVLVINGKHYNSGSDLDVTQLPDSLNGRTSSKLMVLSNRGTVDLHVRIDSMILHNGVDSPYGGALESEFGYNAQYYWGRMVALADGRLEDPTVDTSGGRLLLTIRPGDSATYYYQLEVRTGADGRPKRLGTYTGQVHILSDDPSSGRLHLGLNTRVR